MDVFTTWTRTSYHFPIWSFDSTIKQYRWNQKVCWISILLRTIGMETLARQRNIHRVSTMMYNLLLIDYWKYPEKWEDVRLDGLDSWTSNQRISILKRHYILSPSAECMVFPINDSGWSCGSKSMCRSSDHDKFILPRSFCRTTYARYGAITWSGDVNSSWQSFVNQIPAGLEFFDGCYSLEHTGVMVWFAGACQSWEWWFRATACTGNCVR